VFGGQRDGLLDQQMHAPLGGALDFVRVAVRREADDQQLKIGPIQEQVVMGKRGGAAGGVLLGEGAGLRLVAVAEGDERNFVFQFGEEPGMPVGKAAAAEDGSA